MYDMFDYLEWRGDLSFADVGPNPVDMLILSTLSYIHFEGIVPASPKRRRYLREAAELFFSQTDLEDKMRVKRDLELLEAVAATERFGQIGLSFYRSMFVPEEEKQFAAITYYLGDGTAVVAFRGTDRTLVGWKEDFNMTYQDSIPAQREASKYLEELSIHTMNPIWLTGHSKGGNLSVYAAAKADKALQQRILGICNLDGPGFSEKMMADPGYLAIVPKIHSYVPESSIVGTLFEHAEPHTIIKSKQIGPMQHDPYSWEVLRNDFIHMEEMSEGSKFMDQTTKAWLVAMTPEERNDFVDVVYEILTSGGAVKTGELIHPKQIGNYVKSLVMDEKKRQTISNRLGDLVQVVLDSQKKSE